jgi:DNA polymerase III subunit epsilon
MHLFFDTETTGKAAFHLPANDPSQPYIVQLAAMLTDAKGNSRGEFSTLIKPDGWTITPEAQNVHGISIEDCENFGVPLVIALAMFNHLSKQAKEGIAFNDDFDVKIVDAGFARIQKPSPWPRLQRFCCMKAMTPICKLSSPNFRGRFKWPSLAEAYRHFWPEGFDGAHDAMADVRACKRVYFELKSPTITTTITKNETQTFFSNGAGAQ